MPETQSEDIVREIFAYLEELEKPEQNLPWVEVMYDMINKGLIVAVRNAPSDWHFEGFECFTLSRVRICAKDTKDIDEALDLIEKILPSLEVDMVVFGIGVDAPLHNGIQIETIEFRKDRVALFDHLGLPLE